MTDDKISTLIRDATAVGSIPKSEFRRRLGEILNDYQSYVVGIKEWRAYGERYGFWDYFKEECGKDYKSELREKVEKIGHYEFVNDERIRNYVLIEVFKLIKE